MACNMAWFTHQPCKVGVWQAGTGSVCWRAHAREGPTEGQAACEHAGRPPSAPFRCRAVAFQLRVRKRHRPSCCPLLMSALPGPRRQRCSPPSSSCSGALQKRSGLRAQTRSGDAACTRTGGKANRAWQLLLVALPPLTWLCCWCCSSRRRHDRARQSAAEQSRQAGKE